MLKQKLSDDLLSVILFGSVARGTWTDESDIDLFLIISDNFSRDTSLDRKIIDIILDYEEESDLITEMGVNLTASIQVIPLYFKELNNFRTLFYDIATDGIIITDGRQIASKFIAKIKRRIEEKGLKRVFNSRNDFYWKRPNIKFGEIIEL